MSRLAAALLVATSALVHARTLPAQTPVWLQDKLVTSTTWTDAIVDGEAANFWVLTRDNDVHLTKVNADGATLASVSIDPGVPATTSFSQPNAACSDGAGGVIIRLSVADSSAFGGPGFGSVDQVVSRFDAQGQLLWATRIGTSANDSAWGVACSPGGVIAVALGQRVLELTLAGTVQGEWPIQIQQGVLARLPVIKSAPAGGWVLCGNLTIDFVNFDQRGCVVRLDSAWNLVAETVVAQPRSTFRDAVIAGNGIVIAAGNARVSLLAPGVETLVFSVSPAGTALWRRFDTNSVNASSFARSVVLDSNGDILVISDDTKVAPSLGRAAFLRRISAAGALLDELDLDPTRQAQPGAAWSDGVGSLYVGGRTFDPSSWLLRSGLRSIGSPTCSGQANSTGAPSVAQVIGSVQQSDNAVTLLVQDLPPQQTCLFLGSKASGFTAMAGGSLGDLCLGGAIGRFNGFGEVRTSGPEGRVHLLLDLNAVPQPSGFVPALTGETWFFQCWHRDVMGGAVSNFSPAVSVTLS